MYFHVRCHKVNFIKVSVARYPSSKEAASSYLKSKHNSPCFALLISPTVCLQVMDADTLCSRYNIDTSNMRVSLGLWCCRLAYKFSREWSRKYCMKELPWDITTGQTKPLTSMLNKTNSLSSLPIKITLQSHLMQGPIHMSGFSRGFVTVVTQICIKSKKCFPSSHVFW